MQLAEQGPVPGRAGGASLGASAGGAAADSVGADADSDMTHAYSRGVDADSDVRPANSGGADADNDVWHANSGGAKSAGAGEVAGGEQRVQLQVPHEAAGRIIGRSGASLSQIRQLSGARLEVSEPVAVGACVDAELEGSRDCGLLRTVTITGSHYAVAASKCYLLLLFRLTGCPRRLRVRAQ